MLSDKTIEIVKSYLSFISRGRYGRNRSFLQAMFSHNPELQDIFNMTNQRSGREQFACFNAFTSFLCTKILII